LFLPGDGDRSREASNSCCRAESRLALEDRGNIEDADLKPNLPPVFGGKGGGWSSEFVLPVLLRAGALTGLS